MIDPKICKNCKKPEVHKINLCEDCYAHSVILVKPDGTEWSWYTPQPHQRPLHESNAPNFLAWGTRGTGKSTMLRKDAIIRCLKYPGFKALILRRKITDLRKSHFRFINAEMKALGGGTDSVGHFRETTSDVIFKNGSFIQFSHCETLKDVENYLSSEWDEIVFDELSTFTLDMFLTISSAARENEDVPWKAIVRCGSNPLGIGAQFMKNWFIDHTVDLAEFPDYYAGDFEAQFSTLEENRYLPAEYKKRLQNAPAHYRKAWLLGEFVVEGAYFEDFSRAKHTIKVMPTWRGQPLSQVSWIRIYRSIDWGYFPDPAVCHWHVVLPNKLRITFQEHTKTRTLAKDYAEQVKMLSKGMHITETFCDPTMFIKTGNAPYSIAEIFEQNGVPLTPAQNDRELYGYAIHEMLNTQIETEAGNIPSWQILDYACPELVRTIGLLQMDPHDPRKIADGPDHWVISCAYFAMGQAPASIDPEKPAIPRWMVPRSRHTLLSRVC